METVHQEIQVNHSNSKMFTLAQDYGLRLLWDPFLFKIEFLDGATEAAPKVKVRVQAKNSLTMTVEYITVMPPTHVSTKMVKGPFFFSKFSGTWTFNEIDTDSCSIIFRYKYRIKKIFFLITPFVKYIMNRDMKKRLGSLKYHAENTQILQQLK